MTESNKMHFFMPPEFYRKVLADYNDWRFAWIREVLQNLIDAKAKTAIFTTEDFDNDNIKITVVDDGKGMTRDTLQNGFMSMGGSVKEGGDSDVGGFGVASMMIAQSHVSYVIKSQDFICEGATGTYEIKDNSNYIDGCEISVVMRKSDLSKWSPLEVLKNNVEKWSEFSCVPDLKIIFNGEDLSPKSPKFDYQLESELGLVSFSESSDDYNSSILYVRMKNQPMFSINTYCSTKTNFIGVLDLEGTSQENLTSNRDGLSGNKKDKISTIIRELSNERSKYKLGQIDSFVLNNYAINPNDEIVEMGIFNSDNDTSENDTSENNNELDGNMKSSKSMDSNEGKTAFSQIFNKEKEDFDLLKNSIEKKISGVASVYYPIKFSVKSAFKDENKRETLKKLTSLVQSLNQKRMQKLAWTWKFSVDTMLQTVFESDLLNRYSSYKKIGSIYCYNNKPIYNGFLFNDKAEGACSTSDKDITLLINPDIALNSNFEIEDILDIVFHEVAHIEESGHDDYFIIKENELRRLWRKKINSVKFKNDLKDFIKVQV